MAVSGECECIGHGGPSAVIVGGAREGAGEYMSRGEGEESGVDGVVVDCGNDGAEIGMVKSKKKMEKGQGHGWGMRWVEPKKARMPEGKVHLERDSFVKGRRDFQCGIST